MIDFVVVHLACTNCGGKYDVKAVLDGREFRVHPVDHYMLALWAKAHIGDKIITSYTPYLAF